MNFVNTPAGLILVPIVRHGMTSSHGDDWARNKKTDEQKGYEV